MAGEVDYQYEELQGSVSRLLTMHDDVATLRSQLEARAADAAPGSWPDIPGVQVFAGRYYHAVSSVGGRIASIEQSLESARLALAESIRAMRDVDAAQQEALNRIAAQLDVVPSAVPVSAESSVHRSIS